MSDVCISDLEILLESTASTSEFYIHGMDAFTREVQVSINNDFGKYIVVK